MMAGCSTAHVELLFMLFIYLFLGVGPSGQIGQGQEKLTRTSLLYLLAIVPFMAFSILSNMMHYKMCVRAKGTVRYHV